MKRIARIAITGFIGTGLGISSTPVAAAEAATPSTSSAMWFNGAFILLLLTVIILLCVIAVLGRIVKTLVEEDTREVIRARRSGKVLSMMIPFLLITTIGMAQDAAAPAVAEVASAGSTIAGMDAVLFWCFMGTIAVEFIIILMLLKVLYSFLLKKGLIQPTSSLLPRWMQWKTMVGDDLPIEKESELLTDHDYDGIQELDNGMPPMLKYIFVITIVMAVVYWGYYEMGGGPNQLDEYQTELSDAEVAKAEYLKKAGNLVDENTVKLLDDAAALAGGQKIYATNCVACHGDKGQGGVGPNLTDNFWLHGGTIQDVFKTIKYGVPAKGMRSWQSEIKPGDMQAVASYILKEFGGKNVAGGKAPQGEPLTAATAAPATDSMASAPKTDSAAVK